MKLRIENCNDIQFIIYIIKFIRHYIMSNMDIKKLVLIEQYLNSTPLFQSEFNQFITGREIVTLGAYNLVYDDYSNYYEIFINRNKKISGTDAKLDEVCKLINYGNLSLQGYPIFTQAFRYVEDNIQYIYMEYSQGV